MSYRTAWKQQWERRQRTCQPVAYVTTTARRTDVRQRTAETTAAGVRREASSAWRAAGIEWWRHTNRKCRACVMRMMLRWRKWRNRMTSKLQLSKYVELWRVFISYQNNIDMFLDVWSRRWARLEQNLSWSWRNWHERKTKQHRNNLKRLTLSIS